MKYGNVFLLYIGNVVASNSVIFIIVSLLSYCIITSALHHVLCKHFLIFYTTMLILFSIIIINYK